MNPDPLRYGLFLTIGMEKKGWRRQIAIISDGSPQKAHKKVTVLTIEAFPNPTPREIILEWFERMKVERPWEQLMLIKTKSANDA